MKKFTAFILTLAICLGLAALIYGCNMADKQSPTETPTTPTESTTIEGTVSTVTSSPNGLSNFMLTSDGKEKYLFNLESGFSYAPNLGDEVAVTVKGKITETAPNQAIAEKVSILKEFGGSPINAEVYRIDNIDVTGIKQALNSDRWIFTVIKTYEDLRTYLEQNELTDSVMQKLGSTSIDSLTEEFFASKNLGIFIVNNGATAETAATGTFFENGTLYLRIKNKTADAILNNMAYTAYLIAIDKNTEIAEGIVLTENVLSDNLGNIDINTDDNQTGDQSQTTLPSGDPSQEGSTSQTAEH